jgi:hypothetical protein
MKILDSFKNDHYSLFKVSGDIFTCEPDAIFGLLVVSNKIYYVSPEHINELIDAAIRNEMIDQGNFKYGYELFEFPLSDGQHYGELIHPKRNDLMYSWMVSCPDFYQLKKGDEFFPNKVFSIEKRTAPAYVEIRYIPFVGIAKYAYRHHGTINEYELNLLKFSK